MFKSRSSLTATAISITALLALCAVGASADRSRTRGADKAHGARNRHGHRRHGGHSAVKLLAGPQGKTGATGAAGPQGPQGIAGHAGPQGPGAVEYSYDSTAPAATDQNTPLGDAGPFKLTGSCVQLGANLVAVELGASNADDVQFDQLRTSDDEGLPAEITFSRDTQTPSLTPVDLFGTAASSGGTKESYGQGRLTVTSPVHGLLEVFEFVSEASNECHISVAWIPAA
jgi:hypothetical protein